MRALADVVYSNKDVGAAVASGSFRTRGMIVAPCTVKTLSAIANSFTYNLVVRAADVQLKEGRKLVLMVRETPLHKGHLDLMARAADCGAVILPPMPAFYHRPKTIMDLIHQSLGKALDQVGIEHQLFKRWTGHGRDGSPQRQRGHLSRRRCMHATAARLHHEPQCALALSLQRLPPPGVEAACWRCRTGWATDTNLLLYCCWLASTGRALDRRQLRRAMAAVARWQAEGDPAACDGHGAR